MGNFSYHSLSDLSHDIKKIGIDLQISENTSILFQPIEITHHNTNIYIPNRLAIHPMEGFDASIDGSPSNLTNDRYRKFGRSGAGVVWFEATAVVPEGRSNPHQLFITKESSNKFKELIESFDQGRNDLLAQNQDLPVTTFQNPLKILQLTHSGRYSKPEMIRKPLRATVNHELDLAMNIDPLSGEIVSDEYLDELKERYLDAIEIADYAGFDGIDIKACHGYLISELLGSFSRTKSKYGGDKLEQRGKFLLDVVEKAHQNYPNLLITTRINLFDAMPFPQGFNTKELDESGVPKVIDLSDLHNLLGRLKRLGVRLVNFSAGNPYYKPFLSRPYVQNAFNGPDAPEHPLISIERIHGLLRDVSKQHPDLVTIGTALSWLRQYSIYIAAAEIQRNTYNIAGFGRMAFANPLFPIEIYRNGVINPQNSCIACSKCTELMRMNCVTGCVIRNTQYSLIYKNSYRKFMESSKK